MALTKEECEEQRVEKVSAWLDVLVQSARELELEVLSRASETASEAGTDPDPRLRPCEHRSQWMRGRLCLACDNTGLRPATKQERHEGLSIDPYLLDRPRSIVTVKRDESQSARRARDAERLDAIIATLQRNVRLRAGVEVTEGALRSVRIIEQIEQRLGRDGRKILRVLERLSPPVRLAVLRRDPRALRHFARLVPGSLRTPR